MIQITTQEMINGLPVFQILKTKELRARTAFAVARLIRDIEQEYKVFEQARKDIILKYAEYDENHELKLVNDNVTLAPENIEKCNKELEELLATPIELNANYLTIDELDGIDLTPEQGFSLLPFINEKDPSQ